MAPQLRTAHRIALILLAGAAVIFARPGATSPATGARPFQFEDIARKAGLNFELHNGATGEFHQPELMLGGVAALDYNNDGCMDIFFTNGAAMPSLKKTGAQYSNRLFRNNCNVTFTDVTEKAGVAGDGYSMGVAVGDYDNDGCPDIFVAGVNRNILYHNRGNGTFEDVTAKAAWRRGSSRITASCGRLRPPGWTIDNDGWLDLVVTITSNGTRASNHAAGRPGIRSIAPRAYHERPTSIFRNNRDGTFTDITESSGIAAQTGRGMGVGGRGLRRRRLAGYFRGQRQRAQFSVPQHRRHSKIRGGGAILAGVALNDNGTSDRRHGRRFPRFRQRGLPDAGFHGHGKRHVSRSSATRATRPQFEDKTAAPGWPSDASHSGWGVALYDFDNDGWKDLFTANSHFPGPRAGTRHRNGAAEFRVSQQR